MQKPMTRRTTKRSTLRVQSDLAKPLQTAFCRASRSDLFWNNYSFWKQCSKQQCLEPLFFEGISSERFVASASHFQSLILNDKFQGLLSHSLGGYGQVCTPKRDIWFWILCQENFQGLLSHYLDVYCQRCCQRNMKQQGFNHEKWRFSL